MSERGDESARSSLPLSNGEQAAEHALESDMTTWWQSTLLKAAERHSGSRVQIHGVLSNPAGSRQDRGCR